MAAADGDSTEKRRWRRTSVLGTVARHGLLQIVVLDIAAELAADSDDALYVSEREPWSHVGIPSSEDKK
eukprot:49640-Prorocentrum_lima.AAC.1